MITEYYVSVWLYVGTSDPVPLPELIQLGDKLASFTFPSSPSSSDSALPPSHTHNDETQVDLLTGSPPPTGHTPLISDRNESLTSDDTLHNKGMWYHIYTLYWM